MQKVSTGYVARSQFRSFHRRKQRWSIVVAHRRAGKTVACINDLIDACLRCSLPNPRFAYIAPYFSQAKDVAWNYVKHFSAAIPNVMSNESELRVDFANGGRIRLYGADNYERLRGIYLDGVVIDEFGNIDPRAWSEVIRATLSDRLGWAVFIGTPQHADHFKDMWDESLDDPEWFSLKLPASETGIIPKAELENALKTMGAEKYAAEFECSFEASVVGAFYGREMADAKSEGRICGVPWHRDLPVDTWWDLGIDDATAIWFTQTVGREIHVIDCLEASGEGLPWYAQQLTAGRRADYNYGSHNAPHDIQVRELGSGKSRIETAAGLGIKFSIVPNISRQDGIDAARAFIGRCWFDRDRASIGVKALTSYCKVWDDKRKVFQAQPLHNWASNFADAFRYLAVGHKSSAPRSNDTSRFRVVSGGGSGHGWLGV